MISSSAARVLSILLVAVAVGVTSELQLLVGFNLLLGGILLAAGNFGALRRWLVAILPIVILLIGARIAAQSGSGVAVLGSTGRTLARLSAFFMLFSVTAPLFLGEHAVTTFSSIGVRGEGLVLTLSAVATIPLMQRTSVRIIEARYAAGLSPNRGRIASARQLIRVLSPLFTQALRLAVARSDLWEQRQLLKRLERNGATISTIERASGLDIAGLLASGMCMIAVAIHELR